MDMKRISSLLNGCVVVSNDILRDSRGYFVKAFQEGDFVERTFGLEQVDEVFWTESSQGVARGLHLQVPPKAICKYVMCTSGRVLDLVLDLRSDSETFGQLETVELGPADGLSQGIFVPKGFAHGFITLSETATVVYLQNGRFSPMHDTGVLLESVQHMIPINTELLKDLLSDRDRNLPHFDEFPKYSSSEWQLQNE
jgi:dTDP-4-dehydrorhamnose 3,5-epimerase